MQLFGVQSFLQELESHCSSIAIVTFLDSNSESLSINLKRRGSRVAYGNHWGTKELFIASLLRNCTPSASLVLRTFTDEIDEFSQLPIKELRGYILKSHNNNWAFEKLPPHTMFACHNTDAQTGEPLPMEQAVRYC
ncbi:MAG TPA: hypothetical protein V6D33_16035 [Cyanophyceae cyanobacterium]